MKIMKSKTHPTLGHIIITNAAAEHCQGDTGPVMALLQLQALAVLKRRGLNLADVEVVSGLGSLRVMSYENLTVVGVAGQL